MVVQSAKPVRRGGSEWPGHPGRGLVRPSTGVTQQVGQIVEGISSAVLGAVEQRATLPEGHDPVARTDAGDPLPELRHARRPPSTPQAALPRRGRPTGQRWLGVL